MARSDVDRPRLLAALRNYLIASNLSADWERIDGASNERLVNTLSILSPYGAEEKQALLEATDLQDARRGAGRARGDGARGTRRRLAAPQCNEFGRGDGMTEEKQRAAAASIRSCLRSWSAR